MTRMPTVAATPIPAAAALESRLFSLELELVVIAVVMGSAPELEDETSLDAVAVAEAADFCMSLVHLAVCTEVCLVEVGWDSVLFYDVSIRDHVELCDTQKKTSGRTWTR